MKVCTIFCYLLPLINANRGSLTYSRTPYWSFNVLMVMLVLFGHSFSHFFSTPSPFLSWDIGALTGWLAGWPTGWLAGWLTAYVCILVHKMWYFTPRCTAPCYCFVVICSDSLWYIKTNIEPSIPLHLFLWNRAADSLIITLFSRVQPWKNNTPIQSTFNDDDDNGKAISSAKSASAKIH